jgi:hypothetical protein
VNPTLTPGWLRFLRDRGVLTKQQHLELAYFGGGRWSRSYVRQFAERMIQENPELWVAYLAKRRILNEGEVTVTVTIDQHNFLCNLRDSGAINMFGAAPYLQRRFGLDSREAKEVLLEWMKGPHHEYIEEDTNGLP